MSHGLNVEVFNLMKDVRKDSALPENVIIDDTTLREGEQTPGVVFNTEDKLQIARKLAEVGIQRIESGFPAASDGEKKAVSLIVREGLGSQIFGFGRAVKSDIDAVIECGCEGIVLSFPPSSIHLEHKLRMTREKYLEEAVKWVRYAKSHGLYVTYSAEDSTRTDLDFLKKVFKTVVESGVDCARVVDTLGVSTPTQMKFLVSAIKDLVPVAVEVHCHDDHGLGVANSVAAVEAGASVVSSSVNGMGERAGLAATEEVIVALRNLYGIGSFKTEHLYGLCKLVEGISGVKIPPNKPVCGANIFTHTSGIHQDAVLKSPVTYEPYPPELVGQKRRLILGKLSGSHAVRAKLVEFGINAVEEDVKKLTRMVKEASERRRSALSDEEFAKLVEEVTGHRAC